MRSSQAARLSLQAARANGFADRIECIQALSTEISLPEKPNVIVSDLHGVLPLFEQDLPSIIDARCRLLAPGGSLIPKRDILWAAVVETPQHYDPLIAPWRQECQELNMAAALQFSTNTWKRAVVRPEQLLTEPCRWATIHYATLESPDVSGEMTFRVSRPGTAHGFVVWFDAVLEDGIEFSNAPGQPEMIYGSGWRTPCRSICART